MIRKLAKQFFSYFLSLIMILSIGGFNIFVHYCQIENKEYITLFHSINCDEHHILNSDSCTQDNDEICTHDCTESCKIKSNSKCCSDKNYFLHTDETVLVSQDSKYDINDNPIITYNSFQNNNLINILHTPILQLLPQPPPKIGAFIVILFRTIKIPTFLN